MIDDKDGLITWRAHATKQSQGRMVLDLEADSLHRYSESICLIQYADDSMSTLIDPLAIEDITPFTQWLSQSTIWMHGADYDMTLMLKKWNLLPEMILDTQTAARLLGFRQFGLAALIKHYYDIEVSKAAQKADWAKRPLPENMLNYALSDVHYILGMADQLVAGLQEKGRHHWFTEICEHSMERARQRNATPNEDPWRIQGSGRLTRKGLAALKILWTWRDGEAKIWDKPTFMVCSNADLIQWANAFQESKPLVPSHRFHNQRKKRFNEVIQQLYLIDEDEYPKKFFTPRKPHSDLFEEKLERLGERRNERAEILGIEPSFLITRASLEAIAENEEEGLGQLLNWQREALQF